MRLETERLVITDFTPDMVQAVHENSLDEDNRRFMVVRTGNISSENPDVLDYSQVTGCDLDNHHLA